MNSFKLVLCILSVLIQLWSLTAASSNPTAAANHEASPSLHHRNLALREGTVLSAKMFFHFEFVV